MKSCHILGVTYLQPSYSCIAVEKEALYKLITPLAGAKNKLCVSIMLKLNRLKPVSGGKELMMPIHGKPS